MSSISIPIKGQVIEIMPEVQRGNSKIKSVVVKTDEQYPQSYCIEFFKDKTALLNNVKIGQQIEIQANLKGREHVNAQGEKRYFTSLQGWKVE